MPDRPSNGDERGTRPGAPDSSIDRIGPYRLLEKLGEGGMGEVWLAEQTAPVKREVAIKIIKQGMDTREVVARFESERQALALMNHSAIAKVYEAGATPRGRPYFVMELVKGLPITEHCDRHKLTNKERLGLFLQVCDGVQHAHHKAVIHRDLKPSNVLISIVDDKPVPKIIDFGVAKATALKLTPKTLHTALGVMIGTPAYMSPEQAELTGKDIDTRTDVYALGVMLYELLVGALPFETKELLRDGYEAMARRIREDEPSRPSAKLTTLGEHSTESAKRRSTELPTLKRELSGDLDWITMKALEKERGRRYGSPQEVAEDIQRYLTDQPVLASPPSAIYRTRKFVRRHPVPVFASVTGLLLLVAFGVVMAIQGRRIAAGRVLAEETRQNLEQVAEFQAGMLSRVDPHRMGEFLFDSLSRRVGAAQQERGVDAEEARATTEAFGELLDGINATDVSLELIEEEILDRALSTLEDEFADRPLIDAHLRHTIGRTYTELGQLEPAAEHLEYAVETRKRLMGEEHPATLRSMHSLAIVYDDLGRYDESIELKREVLEKRRRVLGEEHRATFDSIGNLGATLFRMKRYEEALPLCVETLEHRRRELGDDHPNTLASLGNLALLHATLGQHDEAEALYLETLDIKRRALGPDDSSTMLTAGNLGLLYKKLRRFDEAEPLYREVLAWRTRVLGENHPGTMASQARMAGLYEAQGRFDEAEPIYQAVLDKRVELLGENHPDTLGSMNALAWMLLIREPPESRKPERALALSLELNERLGFQDPNGLDTLSLAYHLSGDTPKAIETIQAAIALLGEDETRMREAFEGTLAKLESALE